MQEIVIKKSKTELMLATHKHFSKMEKLACHNMRSRIRNKWLHDFKAQKVKIYLDRKYEEAEAINRVLEDSKGGCFDFTKVLTFLVSPMSF